MDFRKYIIKNYFDEDRIKEKECISNYKNKKMIYRDVIDGETYFIKKYSPKGRRRITIGLGLKKDFSIHYKSIYDRITTLGISSPEPLMVEINKKSIFERDSLFVTRDSGETLIDFLGSKVNDSEKYKYIDRYFYYYINMVQNKIYCTDYNLGGALIKDGELHLIDFDAYKINKIKTNQFLGRLKYSLKKGALNYSCLEDEIRDYLEKKVKETIKLLKWDNIKEIK